MQLTYLVVPLLALAIAARFVWSGERPAPPVWLAVALCLASYPLGILAANALGLDVNSSSGRGVRLSVAVEAAFLAGPVATAARKASRSLAPKRRSRERA
ncbi:hypothetical protein [Streptomyces sp. ME18-1-4]|uniref:hypothetical protein n=1 Tax=Streptomyces sp. ME18-1-4 TaxID=3028685 RepID=UPI0029AD72C8|nr:hypothetical protein [Streptomyces sp. ME18-1-4]MDX3249337.1 hypothetical protein [Streptomyces sp. ME18-1-4]